MQLMKGGGIRFRNLHPHPPRSPPPHTQLYGYSSGGGPDSDRLEWRTRITVRPGPPHAAEVKGSLQLRLGAATPTAHGGAAGAAGAAGEGARVCVRDRFDTGNGKGNVCLKHGDTAPKDWTIEVLTPLPPHQHRILPSLMPFSPPLLPTLRPSSFLPSTTPPPSPLPDAHTLLRRRTRTSPSPPWRVPAHVRTGLSRSLADRRPAGQTHTHTSDTPRG